MTDKIKKIIPVGINPQTEKFILIASFALSVCRALLFYLNYLNSYNYLFEFRDGQRILNEAKRMPYFCTLTEGCFDGFVISLFIFIFMIFIHYGYHYKDSKSIYTMKRLPQKSELHIRCLTVPLISIILCITLSFILILLFYHHYMTMTPPECLHPENQWTMFWVNMIYGGDAL